MALPVAHSCFGLALGILRFVPQCGNLKEALRLARAVRGKLFLCILIANAPDMDFIIGILTGSLNRFHQTGTHTLAGILLIALGLWLGGKYARNNRSSFAVLASEDSARASPVFAFWFVFILLAGHLVIDIFTADTRRPIGLMLAWPFSKEYWHSAVSLFPAPVKGKVMDMFALSNLKNAGWELLISLPFVFAALLSKVWKWPRRAEITGEH